MNAFHALASGSASAARTHDSRVLHLLLAWSALCAVLICFPAPCLPARWCALCTARPATQLLLMRVGAPRWLAFIVTTWGLTAMSFAFMTNRLQFFLLRMLLGMAESGAFPAM